MGVLLLSTDLHEREPFVSLNPAAFLLYIAALGWQSDHNTRGMVMDLALKYCQRRRWRKSLDELMAVGLLEPVDGKWFRIPREIDGWTIWRTTTAKEPRPHIPRTLRAAVYERDGHTCVTCGTTEDLSLDHIHPYSLGGADTLENLQTLCKPCNSRKGARA